MVDFNKLLNERDNTPADTLADVAPAPAPAPEPPQATVNESRDIVTGRLDSEIFRNKQDGFTIAKLFGEDGRCVIVTGPIDNPAWGEVYEFHGRFEEGPRGERFKFQWYRVLMPDAGDVKAIQRWLTKTLEGVGVATARKLVDLYGSEAVNALRLDPLLASVECRFDEEVALKAARQLEEYGTEWLQARIEVATLTGGRRIREEAIRDIMEKWGLLAPAKIKEFPYDLTDFNGIGFTTADAIAISVLGHEREGLPRREAAAAHALQEYASSDGSTSMSLTDLRIAVRNLIQQDADPVIESPPYKIVIDNEGDRAALRRYDQTERSIASRLRSIVSYGGREPLQAEFDLAGLARDQIDAIKMYKQHPVLLLTGRPGTGKTTVVGRIVDAIGGSMFEEKPLLIAPTGKAAKRLAESAKMDASTIHSALKLGETPGSAKFNREKPLPANSIVGDELSMLDVLVGESLFEAVRDNARLLLIGDPEQLPSVGAGNVLADMIRSGVIPHAQLDGIKRSSGDLVKAIHAIGDGMFPDFSDALDPEEGKNIRFIDCADHKIGGTILTLIDRMAARGFDPIWEVQVLAPLNTDGPYSVEALNTIIGPHLLKTPTTECGVRLGEKVIRTKNGTDMTDPPVRVVNGDMGKVIEITDRRVAVEHWFPDRIARYGLKSHRLAPAWAMTVHKAQGSGFPVLILPMHHSYCGKIWTRNWLYTAVSRAEQICLLVGDRSVLSRALPVVRERDTRLADYLRKAFT